MAGRRAVWLVVTLLAAASFAAPPPRPNVILILADDLGYGDLSSYGATDIATPNIDRIANEGIRFTDYYAPANVCSPSRAALLTGRYPFRSGVNGVLFHDTPDGLPLEEITVAETLQGAGYRTALVGKWHLGPTEAFMPWNQGFDVFFGVAHSNDEKNFFVWDGARRIPEPVDQSTLMRRYTDRALAFLREARDGEQPFFLYFAPNIPHVPLYPSKAFAGRSKRGTYGDVVEELDASVGELLAEVAKLGLDDQTLVIFTSDNGPWRAMRDWGGDNGGLREGKTTIFEGGQRVPSVARWPGHVPPHATSDRLATGMDWFPTLVELAGGRPPADRPIDGRTLVPVLTGTGQREPTPFFYLGIRIPVIGEQGFAVGAVRDGQWKLVLPQKGYPEVLEPLAKIGLYAHGRMLFDLAADRAERHDVATAHADVVERLEREVAAFTAGAEPAPVVRVDAAPDDHTGWERMWRGVAAAGLVAAGVAFAIVLSIVLAIAWVVRRAIRARRRSVPG